jgi:hypothetical protein
MGCRASEAFKFGLGDQHAAPEADDVQATVLSHPVDGLRRDAQIAGGVRSGYELGHRGPTMTFCLSGSLQWSGVVGRRHPKIRRPDIYRGRGLRSLPKPVVWEMATLLMGVWR